MRALHRTSLTIGENPMHKTKSNFTVLIGVAVVFGFAISASAQPFGRDNGRRDVGGGGIGNTPLTGDVDASFLPGGPSSRSTSPTEKDENQDDSKVDLSKEPKTKSETIAVLEALTKQQKENIRRMKKELADAKRQKRKPDPRKLKQYANATGDRSAAYDTKSKYVRDLIDRFEAEAPNVTHSGLLATMWVLGKFQQAHYIIEIDRSARFTKMLQEEKRKLQ